MAAINNSNKHADAELDNESTVSHACSLSLDNVQKKFRLRQNSNASTPLK